MQQLTPGVVPIFVNAGAALLPAIIAAVTSLVALLLSPRAMWNLVRRKPWLPVLLVGIVVGAIYLPRVIPAKAPPAVKAKPIDWAGIARDMMAAEAAPHAVLTPLWRNDLQGTTPYSSPVIRGGVLYLPTTLMDISGRRLGSLFAINGSTGANEWVATKDQNGVYLKPFFSSPAITADGSRLVVGQGLHDDADSPLLCFDLTKSAGDTANEPAPVAWAVATPLHVESSPAVFTHDGRQFAVVGAGAIEGKDRLAIGNKGFAFCVDVATGQNLWEYPVNDAESSPAVDADGNVYIGSGFNGNAVVALRSDADLHGKPRLLWKTPTIFPALGDVLLADSSTAGELVLIGGGNGDYVFSDPHPAGMVLALDRLTGKEAWKTPLPDSVLGPLKLTQDKSAVLAACRNGEAYALDLASGKILWHSLISLTPRTPLLAGMATDGPHVFALAADGTLVVLSTETGVVWQREKFSDESQSPQNLTLSTPVYDAATQRLYIATETTGLQAFRVTR